MHPRPIIFEDHTFPLFSKWLQSHWVSSYQQRLPFNIRMMDGGHYSESSPSLLAWAWDMKVWIQSETHITGPGHSDTIVNMTVALGARTWYLHEVHQWRELVWNTCFRSNPALTERQQWLLQLLSSIFHRSQRLSSVLGWIGQITGNTNSVEHLRRIMGRGACGRGLCWLLGFCGTC